MADGVAFGRQTARRIIDETRKSEDRPDQQVGSKSPAEQHFDEIIPVILIGDLDSGDSAQARRLLGANRSTTALGEVLTVYDVPAFITAGNKLPSGTTLRVYHDPAVGGWVLLTTNACEESQ